MCLTAPASGHRFDTAGYSASLSNRRFCLYHPGLFEVVEPGALYESSQNRRT